MVDKKQLGELVGDCAGECIDRNGEFIEKTILEQFGNAERGADGKMSLNDFVGSIIRATIEISVPLGAMAAIDALEKSGVKVFEQI